MTQLIVDQQEITPVPKNLVSLDAILKHVEDTHLASDTVIRQVHVDGRPLISGELDSEVAAMGGAKLAGATVEIFTGKIAEIARESLKEAALYCTRIQTAIPSLAMGLRTNPSAAVFEALKQFCDGFLWLNLLLEKMNAVGDRQSAGGPANPAACQRLVLSLNEMVQAQERGDNTQVADILEYEILELLPGYRRQFVDLEQRLVE